MEDVVSKKAQALLKSLEASLGVSQKDLNLVATNLGKHSAQVFFQQTIEGVTLAPYGNLSFDLSRDGSLARVDSDLIPDAVISNKKQLSADAIQKNNDFKSKGRALLWASRPQSDGGGVPVKHAYEFMEAGFQIVVDAETGKVLLKRDRRMR